MALLVGPASRAGAVQLQVELIAPHRQLPRQGLQRGQEAAQAAVALGRGGRLALPEGQLLQHLDGGTAAVVAHAGQPEGIRATGGGLPLDPVPLDRHRIAVRSDRGAHQGEQLGTATAAPAEQAMREGIGGVPGQLVGAEPAHAGGGGHGRQAGAEAEAIRQPGHAVLPAGEGAAAVVLTLLELAQQRGGAHQHAIGFDPGAVQRFPAAGGHGGLDGGEQGWTVLLQPGVEGRGGVAEVQLGKALQQVEGGAEGALGGPPGVRHWPEPGQIEVGMAQHLHAANTGTGWHPGLTAQAHQLRHRRGEQAEGIGRILGLEHHLALDQGTVVVEGAAQPQLQLQRLPLPPGEGQLPAAGGVEEITGMHGHTCHPQLHRIGPPAQTQAGAGGIGSQLGPGGRQLQPQAQVPPEASAGPDHQPPRRPVGPVQGTPGMVQRGDRFAIRTVAAPEGLEIERHGRRGRRT